MRILQRPSVCRVSVENENFLRSKVSLLCFVNGLVVFISNAETDQIYLV